ncbi:MAG: HesA/MoeB/ThiF family protein [Candidatus Jordarchaeum sp.]|uniref:HesA/MoeB/ThiF family protein n=1 Tax=Candidatus Jordarchaeum sp. TaxID=2823881 RepID=UPI0040491B6E
MSLSKSEKERYDRQMRISEWGEKGQKKIKQSKVVVMGVGGLGCPASIYLAAAGIGNLVLVDKESSELSNLNRQILHWQKDIGKPKVISAKEKLEELNPEIKVEAIQIEITDQNIEELVAGATVVVDAMDNFEIRFMINKNCVKKRIPFVHAGIYGFQGQMTTILPGKGPCLRCIFPTTPPEADKFPVAGVTPGVLGILQATEVIKLITGIGEPLIGKLLFFDGEDMTFIICEASKNPNCKIC